MKRKLRIDRASSATSKVAQEVDKAWHDAIDLQKFFIDSTPEEFPAYVEDRLEAADLAQDLTQYLFYAKRKLHKLKELMIGY